MAIWDDPVLNSAFAEPKRHYALDDKGVPTGAILEHRRQSAHLVPIPPPKKTKQPKGGEQAELFEGEPESALTANLLINELRTELDKWRRLDLVDPKAKLTHTSRRLLEHWRRGLGEQPLFFCQIEAIETLIWLAEVAPVSWHERLAAANAEANPDLFRLCCKMATGAGKTTVMALLIAWQAINHARMGTASRFANRFLLVAPGITIKDRLRVLLPSDPDNYYETRNLVPRDMLGDLRKARVVITNYHAFKRKERLQAPKLTRQILGGRDGEASFLESEGQMLARVCPELLAGKGGVIVINDEAHHCYRARAETEEAKVSAEEKEEAKRNAEAARLWISGVEALKRKIGVKAVYDLSATPFFLRGSGWKEGTLFPWVVSDFALMDAIECGIVKVPRVPIADDRIEGGMPLLRNVYRHIKGELLKKGRLARGPGVDARKAYRHRSRAVTVLLEFGDHKGRAHAVVPVLVARLLPVLFRPEVAWAAMAHDVPYRFAVRPLTQEEGGGYLIEFPDLPGCISDGETVEETIVNGVDAMHGWIVAMQAERFPVSVLVQPFTAE